MKIDPRDNSLYTDSGKFLKTLHCPLRKNWNELVPDGNGARTCDACSRKVHDTSVLSDEQLVSLLDTDPEACLAVSQVQDNCTVLPAGIRHHRKNVNE